MDKILSCLQHSTAGIKTSTSFRSPFSNHVLSGSKVSGWGETANIKNSNKKNGTRLSRSKLSVAAENKQNTRRRRKKKKKNSLANSPQCTKSRFMSPCRCGNHERSVLSSFVIQSLRFLPSLSSFSPLLFPGAVAVLEPVSLFCFDVYKPAKPQTPVQVQSSGTVRGAAREPLLSFACSLTLSPPASLSLYLSLSLPDSPAPLQHPPSPLPSPPPSQRTRCFTPVRPH